MTPQLHEALAALQPLYFSGELTEEEWALLQIHLAYCDHCRIPFEAKNRFKVIDGTDGR